MKWCALVVIMLESFVRSNNIIDPISYGGNNCQELITQDSLDIDEIMGKWYVVEVIEHKHEPLKPMSGAVTQVDTCPTVRLWQSEQSTYLKMAWIEDAGDLEYSFGFLDPSRRPGLWKTMGFQNGSLAQQRTYTQFSGTVNVMKAVASHIVLTFCSQNMDGQLYSVLLSRDHALQKSEVRGVHNLLNRRKLKRVGIRATCANNSNQIGPWQGFLRVNIASISILATLFFYRCRCF